MKTIIAGSRTINNFNLIEKTLINHSIFISELISGTANGVDTLGEKYALKHNIPIKKFPADWNKFGKRAGYLRNVDMAKYAYQCIIFWDGVSKGTKHMIKIAKEENLKLRVFIVK